MLRVMTYNIRHGLGGDGRVDLGRIAEVIASYGPDVVGIQEVDVNRKRSGQQDQGEELARRLNMTLTFHPCLMDEGKYGIATLSRLTVRATRHFALPSRTPHSEPRCALVTRLDWDSTTVDIINTHLSTDYRDRPAQTEMIGGELGDEHAVVIGDLNCTPFSSAYKRLCCGLTSATRFARTWPAMLPVVSIDHILVRGLDVVRAGTWTAKPARIASDHLPVYAELSV